jgi:hypothetical protein
MSLAHELTDEELHQRGLEVLQRELGTLGAVRFLRLLGACRGDYTAERQEWVETVTLDQIWEGIQRLRQQKEPHTK